MVVPLDQQNTQREEQVHAFEQHQGGIGCQKANQKRSPNTTKGPNAPTPRRSRKEQNLEIQEPEQEHQPTEPKDHLQKN